MLTLPKGVTESSVAGLMVREASVRSYPEIGVPDSHHPLSHHQNDPEKLARQAKLNTYQMMQLTYFVDKLATLPESEW